VLAEALCALNMEWIDGLRKIGSGNVNFLSSLDRISSPNSTLKWTWSAFGHDDGDDGDASSPEFLATK